MEGGLSESVICVSKSVCVRVCVCAFRVHKKHVPSVSRYRCCTLAHVSIILRGKAATSLPLDCTENTRLPRFMAQRTELSLPCTKPLSSAPFHHTIFSAWRSCPLSR